MMISTWELCQTEGKRVSWKNKEKRFLFYDKNGKKVSRAKEKNRGMIGLVK